MRALLLSAYAAVSHQFWAEQVMAHTDADWTTLTLPPRHFSWRVRGNPLTWALKEHARLNQPYDLLLATSMVDLATLIGLYPGLGSARKVVYFHENQFAYPESSQQMSSVEAKMVNLYSALAADEVIFNSAYNRDSFIDGARAFLKKMPENLPAAARLEMLRNNAHILPVPILPEAVLAASFISLSCNVLDVDRPNRVIWNHRWEYDKNPQDFFTALYALSDQGIPFELAVMGQQFRQSPEVFEQARERLDTHIIAWGAQPESDYKALLSEGGIVVSTTWHEFQGLAIMEAAQRGVLPLVPDRLCFPEFYPPEYRYDGSVEGLQLRLQTWLTNPATRPPLLATERWEWPQWQAPYQALLGV
ncbi:MAG: tRNA-queuosine alpha-mannosyltransferase domain-containing protein [Pseudomonadota bacterium]